METPATKTSKSSRVRPLTRRDAWRALQQHAKQMRAVHLRELFAQDAGRGERMRRVRMRRHD